MKTAEIAALYLLDYAQHLKQTGHPTAARAIRAVAMQLRKEEAF